MKRRNFIAATSVIFASGVTASATTASSTFNSFSTEVSLNEFSNTTKKALKNFTAELEKGFEQHSRKGHFIKNTAMPVRIINKQEKRGFEAITYKNSNGEYIKLTVKKGVETIHISKSPFRS